MLAVSLSNLSKGGTQNQNVQNRALDKTWYFFVLEVLYWYGYYINYKDKKELRDEVKKTASKLGIPVTTAVNALLKQFVRDKEIVLSINVPNEKTRRAINEARTRKNLETFKSFADWKKAMRSS